MYIEVNKSGDNYEVTPGINIEDNKTIEITESGDIEITPSTGNLAMKKVTATINVDTQAPTPPAWLTDGVDTIVWTESGGIVSGIKFVVFFDHGGDIDNILDGRAKYDSSNSSNTDYLIYGASDYFDPPLTTMTFGQAIRVLDYDGAGLPLESYSFLGYVNDSYSNQWPIFIGVRGSY